MKAIRLIKTAAEREESRRSMGQAAAEGGLVGAAGGALWSGVKKYNSPKLRAVVTTNPHNISGFDYIPYKPSEKEIKRAALRGALKGGVALGSVGMGLHAINKD